jgi:hypothetical protein
MGICTGEAFAISGHTSIGNRTNASPLLSLDSYLHEFLDRFRHQRSLVPDGHG